MGMYMYIKVLMIVEAYVYKLSYNRNIWLVFTK